MLSIVFVDQVHYNLYHDIFFLCSAFGYHERKGDEGAVGDAFGTILTVENAVVVHKPKEEGSCNAFVTVTEGMVLGDEIEQHGGLLLYTGIEVRTVEGLIDLPDGALERVVLLVGGVKDLLAYPIAEKYDFILCFARFTLPLPTLSICLLMDAYFRICSTLATSTGRCM